jgi:2-oxoisovalerate dehydrogenase E1 component alpha subunit
VGLKLRCPDAAVMAYVGDGGSSEGDFHEALNLASVQRCPVVFFMQNNQWAI